MILAMLDEVVWGRRGGRGRADSGIHCAEERVSLIDEATLSACLSM